MTQDREGSDVPEEPSAEEQRTTGDATPDKQAERVSGATPTEYSPAEREAAATGEGPATTPDTEAAAAATGQTASPEAAATPSEPPAAPDATAPEPAAAAERPLRPERPPRPERPAAAAATGDALARPERPAREAPKGPEPPVPGSIFDTFKKAMPDIEWVDAIQGLSHVILSVTPEDVPYVMRTAKEHPELKMDFLRSLHGVDQQPDGFDVVYLLHSYQLNHGVEIKTRVPQEDPRVSTVTPVWKGANWHERETRDLYGVVFDGHPDLRPLLMPEDLIDVHPHRKDYPLAEIEIMQGEGAAADESGEAE